MTALIIGGNLSHGAGYMLNDNRASGNGVKEADIVSCPHCQALIELALWKEDGGFCGKCNKPVCGPCADRMATKGCAPFVKLIEDHLDKVYRQQQNAKVLGI